MTWSRVFALVATSLLASRNYRRGPIDPKRAKSLRVGQKGVFNSIVKTTSPESQAAQLLHDDASLIQAGRKVVATELAALRTLPDHIDQNFARAVQQILSCKGSLVLSGMGKPGFVAQKLSATFASTGTPSIYLHPAEALHGDLGRLRKQDLILALSNSGRTHEIVQLLPRLRELGSKVIALTGDRQSILATHADVVLDIGKVVEACPLGLAPTTSSTAMLVLGDALAMTTAQARGLRVEDFARLHPGGSLGQSLLKVDQVMRSGKNNPLISNDATLIAAIKVMTETPGRPGAAVIVDAENHALGIFTDGDLRRLLEGQDGQSLDLNASLDSLVKAAPLSIMRNALLAEALQILRERGVDQLVVTDAQGCAVGLLDVQDLLAARVL